MVSRIGLASGYGVPAAAVEKAHHEYGINYLYISPLLNLGNMVKAINNLARNHRDELLIVLARPFPRAFRLEPYVERWLGKLHLDWVDLLFQDVRKPFGEKVAARLQRLKDRGLVRFVGMSSHNRPLLGKISSGEVEVPIDFFHTRYNAVHSGAEQDIFPFLKHDRPGVVAFTATCWRKLLKAKSMPLGEQPLTAAECYRFALSNPNINICMTGPKNEEQLVENLEALEAGPLDEEEMSRVRRIGRHIYGK
jgi:aryl-alcohol dehydrogenase-like predicted oxidoreductase